MNDITIIIPVHKLEDEEQQQFYIKALQSIQKNIANYTFGKLSAITVGPKEVITLVQKLTEKESLPAEICQVFENEGETDFCSQINCVIPQITTDFFSILEFDDEYKPKWFTMAHNYYYSHEDVSLFLPINILFNTEGTLWAYGNELAWASSFSDELGFVDEECLKNSTGFSITGGVFNKADFVKIGMLKPSIKLAFQYEFLLRLAKKHLKILVVPKEGYRHLVGRKGSLTDIYADEITDEEQKYLFELAKQESTYCEDRGVLQLEKAKPEEIK